VQADFSTVVPFPFGNTFALAKPTVTGLSRATVLPGNLFTVEGTGLHPSLIQGVFIGGQPVNMANVVSISDTAIEILAPNTPSRRPQSVVVRTNQGFSNNNVKIIIQIQSSKASARRQQLSHQSFPVHRRSIGAGRARSAGPAFVVKLGGRHEPRSTQSPVEVPTTGLRGQVDHRSL
jgi:hypothetical protein